MKQKTKKEIKYTDEPLGDIRIIDDFLPPPEQLAFKEENVRITLTLSSTSLDFFKREAEKHHTKYQEMIRKLLDIYAERHCNRSDS
ncbi:MAG: CopG family transcriptional regulator [Candidatus Electrothrix sp. EH2]|nr:CopG family transcriptional regulator [Candidatus Electrothrix sp. EH2]